MKDYFERLQRLATNAITELRKMDAHHTEMHRAYLEDRMKGDLTEQGFRSLVKSLDDASAKKKSEISALLDGLQCEYEKAVDDYSAPSVTAMNRDDVALLKNLELSPTEFERMAEKYRDNPTMGRFLDNYRKEHNVGTNWRFQTPEQRKDIFNNVRFGVESIIRTPDKYNENREGSVAKLVSNAYHKLQGSDPDAFQLPKEAPALSEFDKLKASGTTLF